MAKIVKRKKRRARFNITRFTAILFMVSACAYLASSLFLRSYNNSLSTAAQNINTEIAGIETKNDALQAEIQTLSSSDRIDQIAANDSMSRNQNSITTITDTASADGE